MTWMTSTKAAAICHALRLKSVLFLCICYSIGCPANAYILFSVSLATCSRVDMLFIFWCGSMKCQCAVHERFWKCSQVLVSTKGNQLLYYEKQ